MLSRMRLALHKGGVDLDSGRETVIVPDSWITKNNCIYGCCWSQASPFTRL